MSDPTRNGPPYLDALAAEVANHSAGEILGAIRADQDRRWAAAERVPAEAYLAAFPAVAADPEQALVLIYGEVLARAALGESPGLAEYQARFPNLAGRLALQFEVHDALGGPTTFTSDRSDATQTRPRTGQPMEDGRSHDAPPGYVILGELGRGGMGVVYKARQTALNRVVALKMVLAGGHAGSELLARFRGEAEAVARLQHPNIVQIYEVGEASGLPYFSLEFCPGGSLGQKLDGTPLLPKQAAELVETLAKAIHAAHEVGVVHRDLKPANVLLSDDPASRQRLGPEGENRTLVYYGLGSPATMLKITDFGLAKMLDTADGQTRSGAIMGTPSYMAPEQAAGESKKIGPAADVHALGAILYECLTGRPPFKGATMLETIDQVRGCEPVPPSRLQPNLPRDLETVCLKCLAKEPAKRYATAAALAEDLRRWQSGEPIAARPAGPLERAAKWARRRPAAAALLGVVVLAATSGVAGTWAFTIRLRQERDSADYERRQAESQRQLAAERELLARRYLLAANMNLAQTAWDEAHVGRVLQLLKETRAEPGQEDVRGFEWHYLHRLCHGDHRTLWGHTGKVTGAAFSPDGTRLASASHDRTVRVWDAATGRERFVLKGHTGSVRGVAYSADGARLASVGADSTVRVWDAATGRELLTIQGGGNGVAFTPDGARLASAGLDSMVRVWDAATGRELLTVQGEGNGVAFSPDGVRLASAGADSAVRVWDAATGRELLTIQGGGNAVAFSPDGARLASAGRDGVRVWDAATGQELLDPKGQKRGDVLDVAFSPDGARLASAGADTTVQVWAAATGWQLFELKGHTAGVLGVAFSPDGARLASAGADTTVRIWDAATEQELPALKGQTTGVLGVAFSPDGARLASAGEDGTIQTRDAVTGRELVYLKGGGHAVAYSPDGAHLASAGGSDQTVRVRDAATGQELLALQGHTSNVLSVAFSPDGARLASAGEDGTIRTWDAATGRGLLTIQGGSGCVAFSPDGARLASAGLGSSVQVWDAATGRELLVLKGPTGGVLGVAFSPDGARLAGAGMNSMVRVWDAATGRELLSFEIVGRGVAFSPDGARLASASKDGVRVWDAITGRELLFLYGGSNGVAFSPDGARLAGAGTDSTVRIWDARPLTEELRNERDAVSRLEFLFDRPLLRDEVRDFLRTDKTISDPVRQLALKFLEQYTDDPRRLVRRPRGDAARYHRAVELAEAACRREPENRTYLTILGVALYRVGQIHQALDALTRSRTLNPKQDRAFHLADVAFLAMCYQQIGQNEPAQKLLTELREWCRQKQWIIDVQAQAFLREAEALIDGGQPRP